MPDFPGSIPRKPGGMDSESPKQCQYNASFNNVENLQLNIGGVAEQLAVYKPTVLVETKSGFRLRVHNITALGDCDLPTCRSLNRAHRRLATAGLLHAKVIFPLSAAVVVFADDLGGLAGAAKILAGFAKFSPIVEVQPPPYLFVIARNELCTGSEREFNRMVAMELLCFLRAEHPECSYTFAQTQQMWARRVSGVQFTSRVAALVYPEVLQRLEDVSNRRLSHGFGLSTRRFREILRMAISSFTCETQSPFNLLQALGIRSPVTSYAKASLQKFLDGGGEDFRYSSIAASCLAFYAYTDDAYVCYPGLVAESFAGRLLSNCARRNRVLAQIRQRILQMVQDHQNEKEPLVVQHLQLMRGAGVSLPGCDVCLFKIPIHKFTCRHKFCDHCMRFLCAGESTQMPKPTSLCFLCDKPNLVHISQKPFNAPGRVLVLPGSAGSVLKFLSNMRGLLFGNLADYVDLIITSKSAVSVVLDYFCFGSSIAECSRHLKASKKLPALCNVSVEIPKSPVLISVFDGKEVLRTYGDSPKLKHAPQVRYTGPCLTPVRGKRFINISPQLANAESEAIWGSEAQVLFEYGTNPGAAKAVSGRLLAALFYVEVSEIQQATAESSALYQMVIKCRLSAGPHLNAVIRALLDDCAILHCECSPFQLQMQFCDLNTWREITSSANRAFLRKIEVKVESIDCRLDLKIETKGLGWCENVSNSPRTMVDLVNDLPAIGTGDSRSRTSLLSDDVAHDRLSADAWSISRLDDQIEELEGILAKWK